MDYNGLKVLLSNNKDKLFVGGCFVIVFFIGFGAGKFIKFKPTSLPQANYTTNSLKKPFLPVTQKEEGDAITGAVKATSTDNGQVKTGAIDSNSCFIKGNISSAGKKIYHIKGGAFYERTKAEQCFTTEDEAQAAGFIKSSR